MGVEKSADRKLRLVGEGRWNAFADRKTELARTGMTPKEADTMAAREFSPLVPTLPPLAVAPAGDPLTFTGNEAVQPLAADLEWVRSRLGTPKGQVKPEDAPTRCAYWLLQYSRTDPGKFANDFLKSLLPSKSQQDAADKFNDDGREQIDLIERVQQHSRESVSPSGA